jgi:Raf kinase inhibitor-like YbhB/YbcL family protein
MRPFRHAGSSILFLMLSAGALGACSSSSGSPNDAASPTDAGGFDYATVDGPQSPATMTLTSSALAEGAVFADTNTCAGVNTSPPLTWTPGPTGTMSYAVVLSDLKNAAAHWVIWDIPATTTSLAAALPGDTTLTTPPVGAQQLHKIEFFMAGGAYRGPCPGASGPHTYVFEVSAVPTAKLALGENPKTEEIRVQLQAVAIAHGDLSGTSSAMSPPADAGGDTTGQ